MIRSRTNDEPSTITIRTHAGAGLAAVNHRLATFASQTRPSALSSHPGWLSVLQRGLGHDVFAIEAMSQNATCGYLPLAFVSSMLFGKFLVSLPYLNSNGVLATAPDVQELLIRRACELADELDVRHLELRHETPIAHALLTGSMTSKVHMRMPLPDTTEKLWKKLDTKVRNQIRKGEKAELTHQWGGLELLEPFYKVLSHNMRDLGTPVYSKQFFAEILTTFPSDAEVCVLRVQETPVAAGMLLHGQGITEVPTASSLREYNSTCANMLMYRHLLDRAVERRQAIFDFGRSTLDGPTFKFKKQWGATPTPATWQYYLRSGALGEMRPENPRYQKMIRMWQRLPIRVTQAIGPSIVRGIP